LTAEKQKATQLKADTETATEELAAEERKSGRLEKQTKKLEKQLAKLKEEKTQLKKRVVSDGQVVVNEKIYTRLKARFRGSNPELPVFGLHKDHE
jgi:chromosome segregation ATPase